MAHLDTIPLTDRRWPEGGATRRENALRLFEGVEAFCARVRGSLKKPSFEVKQKVLQLVVDRVVVVEDRVITQHAVPTGPVRLQTEQFVQKHP